LSQNAKQLVGAIGIIKHPLYKEQVMNFLEFLTSKPEIIVIAFYVLVTAAFYIFYPD